MGFHRLASDFWLYILGEGTEALYLALYVDDLYLVCIEIKRICGVKSGLGERYNMKDLGETKFLLGLGIRRRPNGDVFLCQEKYGRELFLSSLVMQEYNYASTPLEIGVKFFVNLGMLLRGAAIEGVGYNLLWGVFYIYDWELDRIWLQQ